MHAYLESLLASITKVPLLSTSSKKDSPKNESVKTILAKLKINSEGYKSLLEILHNKT
jgi:hypothetical protein